MVSARTACLAALALAVAAGPAAAQLNINFNINRPRHNLGTIGGWRPPVQAVPPIGVVRPPPVRPVPPVGDIGWRPPVRPIPPVGSLRPTIYPPAYLRLFPPGRRTILVGNVVYYYFPTLPPGATPVTIRGSRYYHAGGVWFQRHSSGGRRIFLAVPPPL